MCDASREDAVIDSIYNRAQSLAQPILLIHV